MDQAKPGQSAGHDGAPYHVRESGIGCVGKHLHAFGLTSPFGAQHSCCLGLDYQLVYIAILFCQ